MKAPHLCDVAHLLLEADILGLQGLHLLLEFGALPLQLLHQHLALLLRLATQRRQLFPEVLLQTPSQSESGTVTQLETKKKLFVNVTRFEGIFRKEFHSPSETSPQSKLTAAVREGQE